MPFLCHGPFLFDLDFGLQCKIRTQRHCLGLCLNPALRFFEGEDQHPQCFGSAQEFPRGAGIPFLLERTTPSMMPAGRPTRSKHLLGTSQERSFQPSGFGPK